MSQQKPTKKQVHNVLRGWHNNSEKPQSLFKELMLHRSQLSGNITSTQHRFATNKVLADGIQQLAIHNEIGAEILQRRFRENDTIKSVAVLLNLSDDQINRQQREAITQLTTILSEQEQALQKQLKEEIEASLPITTYKRLFGFEEILPDLKAQLLDPEAARVICLTGIGGIGKTSLADATVRLVIPEFYFDKVIWLRIDPALLNGMATTPQLVLDVVSSGLVKKLLPELAETLVREERMQRIRAILAQTPFLVVIDNIETNADTGMLLAHLNDWAGCSKFLVTTRTWLTGSSAILSYNLTELSKANAGALVKHQAAEKNLHDFAAEVDSVIDDIYDVTGGNPLALKLIVSLLSYMPLPYVLSSLRKGGSTNDVDQIYTRIYFQAWQTLNERARRLLKAMPLVGEEGGEVEELEAISQLPSSEIWVAITDLVNRSLIEVRGGYKQRLYGIHRLTMTFLQTEIIKGAWQFDE